MAIANIQMLLRTLVVALFALALPLAADAAPKPVKPGKLRVWLTGNSADSARAPVGGPGLLLMGGSNAAAPFTPADPY